MRNQTLLSLVAACLCCALLAGALSADHLTSLSLMVLSSGFGISALVYWLAPKLHSPIHDPYDLNLLREIHERGEAEPPVEADEEPGAYLTAVCRNCGELYDSHLGACPRCGQSQYC